MIEFGNMKLNWIDYMLVVNREFTIVYGSRFDSRIEPNKVHCDPSEYINRNFFEVYPSVKKETSSIVRCLTTGEIVVKASQRFLDFRGLIFCTHNITIPLIRKGKIIGALELSKDVTTINNVEHPFLDEESLKLDGVMEWASGKIEPITFDKILTVNPVMLQSIDVAKHLVRMPNPTLIYGETGTGKELVTQAMITESGIKNSKVIVQNCAAVPENLIESILFGTAKGAYTGAENHKGLFEQADGGIIFLDELNSLPYHVQGKFLRVLQDGTFRSIGDNVEKRVNLKIIAAMNVDPMVAIEKKILRSDLFYRLSGGLVYLPPLRERKDDIEFFINHYIEKGNFQMNKQIKGISQRLREVFLSYHWGGNVRECKHIIESMISACEGDFLDVKDLPAYLYDQIHNKKGSSELERKVEKNKTSPIIKDFSLTSAVERTERDLIIQVMNMAKGNKTKAAELLKIPRQTLGYKINKYCIFEGHWIER